MNIKYYLDPATNKTYGYPDDGSLDSIIPGTYTSISLNEAQNIVNPPLTLDQQKTSQKDILTASYQDAIQVPVSYMGTTFQTDLSSQETLNKVLVALGGTTPGGFYWVDSNNTPVTMNFAQLQGLASTMMAQGWVAFQHLQAKKAAVNTATSKFDVTQITW
jgi:hypothetical protein